MIKFSEKESYPAINLKCGFDFKYKVREDPISISRNRIKKKTIKNLEPKEMNEMSTKYDYVLYFVVGLFEKVPA